MQDDKPSVQRPTYAMIDRLSGDVKDNRKQLISVAVLTVCLSAVTLGVVLAGNELSKESHVSNGNMVTSDKTMPVATAKFEEKLETLTDLLDLDIEEIGDITSLILEGDSGEEKYYTVTGYDKFSNNRLVIYTARGDEIEVTRQIEDRRRSLLQEGGCCVADGGNGDPAVCNPITNAYLCDQNQPIDCHWWGQGHPTQCGNGNGPVAAPTPTGNGGEGGCCVADGGNGDPAVCNPITNAYLCDQNQPIDCHWWGQGHPTQCATPPSGGEPTGGEPTGGGGSEPCYNGEGQIVPCPPPSPDPKAPSGRVRHSRHRAAA